MTIRSSLRPRLYGPLSDQRGIRCFSRLPDCPVRSSMPFSRRLPMAAAASMPSAATICMSGGRLATTKFAITETEPRLVLTAGVELRCQVVTPAPSAPITVTEIHPGVSPLGTYAALVAEGVSGAVSGQMLTVTYVAVVKLQPTIRQVCRHWSSHHRPLYINAGATNCNLGYPPGRGSGTLTLPAEPTPIRGYCRKLTGNKWGTALRLPSLFIC